jgi:hypothetical protein
MIRKISVGIDLLNAMHFIVGQSVLRDSHKIVEIRRSDDGYHIRIKNENEEIVLWKTINNFVPVTIEYDLNF